MPNIANDAEVAWASVPASDDEAAAQGLADTVAADPRDRTDDTLARRAHKAQIKSRLFATRSDAPKIGRYAILKVLGEGGMGTVFSAYDDALDRRVAVKRLKTASAAEGARMLREAQAMAKLSHPNVVPVFEVGTHDGELFLVMEYVRGMTLHRWQADATRPWLDILRYYLQAGRGLAAAHERGLVHRDFKPHNAVVGEDGRVRVLDFGLAARDGDPMDMASGSTIRPRSSAAALDSPLTETGTVMGTPAYMAPEQVLGGNVDQRSDQFSFCVALWEALYDRHPFEAENVTALHAKVARGELTEPRRTGIPAKLRAPLERGLSAVADERWPSLGALLEELERFVPRRAETRSRDSGGNAALAAGLATALSTWWSMASGASTVSRIVVTAAVMAVVGAAGGGLLGYVVRKRKLAEPRDARTPWWRLTLLAWPCLGLGGFYTVFSVGLTLLEYRQLHLAPLLMVPIAVIATATALTVHQRVLPGIGRPRLVIPAAVAIAIVLLAPWRLLDLVLPAVGLGKAIAVLGSALTSAAAVALTRASDS